MSADRLDGWNLAAYEAFRDLRLRPALDLLARVPELPAGALVDLGCGAGAAAPALRARFPGRRLIGVDGAPEMLAKAAPLLDEVVETDIAAWAPASSGAAPALIFSNAALHWLPDHQALLPPLFAALAQGGALAVQMPDQLARPSHRTMIEAAAAIRPDIFTGWTPFPGPAPLSVYAAMFPGAALDLWTTEYLQRLGPAEDGAHPVRAFTSSTGGRPILARLDPEERARFDALWDAALVRTYPVEPDGGCWFPFQRVFFVALKSGAG